MPDTAHHREQTQDIGQSVISHVQRGQVRQSAPTQGSESPTGPVLDPVHAMVGLREHMDQPHQGHFTHTQSFPQTVGRNRLIAIFKTFQYSKEVRVIIVVEVVD